MMKKMLITPILGLLVWSAIPAGPARATSTIFIDDSRDGVQCPGATRRWVRRASSRSGRLTASAPSCRI
jgi:hypothetical protein